MKVCMNYDFTCENAGDQCLGCHYFKDNDPLASLLEVVNQHLEIAEDVLSSGIAPIQLGELVLTTSQRTNDVKLLKAFKEMLETQMNSR